MGDELRFRLRHLPKAHSGVQELGLNLSLPDPSPLHSAPPPAPLDFCQVRTDKDLTVQQDPFATEEPSIYGLAASFQETVKL